MYRAVVPAGTERKGQYVFLVMGILLAFLSIMVMMIEYKGC